MHIEHEKPFRAIHGTKGEPEVCFSTIECVTLVNFKDFFFLKKGKEI